MANKIRFKVVTEDRLSITSHLMYGHNTIYSLYYGADNTVVAPKGTLGIGVFMTYEDARNWIVWPTSHLILRVRHIGWGHRLERVPSIHHLNGHDHRGYVPGAVYDLAEATEALRGWGKGKCRWKYNNERVEKFWPTPPGTMFYDAVYVLD